MKILQVKYVDDGKNYLYGNYIQKGKIQVLVDNIPNNEHFEYEKICGVRDFYYAEKDGFISCYQYEYGTTDSFGGSEKEINIKGEGLKKFKGSLWNPFDRPEGKFWINIAVTEDIEVMKRGHTFCNCKITHELFEKIKEKLNVV